MIEASLLDEVLARLIHLLLEVLPTEHLFMPDFEGLLLSLLHLLIQDRVFLVRQKLSAELLILSLVQTSKVIIPVSLFTGHHILYFLHLFLHFTVSLVDFFILGLFLLFLMRFLNFCLHLLKFKSLSML